MEKKGRGSQRSDRPGISVAAEIKEKRDAFLQTFFKRGAQLTEELVRENKRLHDQLTGVEAENAALKTQLASDKAIRDLLRKIDELEREKTHLLSTVHEQEEITNRYAMIESELESFANLYVASFQLHASLRPRAVMRNVKELLMQLVGVRSLAVYFVDDTKASLVPIACEGIDLASMPSVPLRDATTGNAMEVILERTYLTGVPHVAEGEVESSGARGACIACIPMQLEDRAVGAIAVYSLLEHKKRFVAVDRELFKLLAAHAGGALVAAYLWAQGDGRLPSAEALREICA
jgi:hypothetical protein